MEVHTIEQAFELLAHCMHLLLQLRLHPLITVEDLSPVHFVYARIYHAVLCLPFELTSQQLHLLDMMFSLEVRFFGNPRSSFHELLLL